MLLASREHGLPGRAVGLRVHGLARGAEGSERVGALLAEVGLPATATARFGIVTLSRRAEPPALPIVRVKRSHSAR